MKEERKLITRSDTNEYTLKRERGQTISFAKIQELLLRNVTKNENKTYTQFTRELLDRYAQSPSSNLDKIREISRFLTRVSMLYKLMIYYLSTLPIYTYNITPISDYTSDYNTEKILKNYEKVLKIFHSFNMSDSLMNIIGNTIRDGMSVNYMYNSEKDGMFFMPLDINYCRIRGKTSEGQWIVWMDASYFDSGNNKDFIYGVNQDGIGVWDQCFIDGYEQYKTYGRDYQWFGLPPENTFCMIAGTDDEFSVPLPYFLPIFNSLLRLLDTEALVADKEQLQNYKLILNKIPLIKNSQNVDDFSISFEMVEYFNNLLKEIVPDLVGVGTSPFEGTDVIDFNKSVSAVETDELNKAMNNLFQNAGINKLIVSSGDSSNANGIKYSNANDLGKVSVYLKRIESWFNYWIKHNVSDGFYLEIFPETWYNRDDFIKEKKEAASLGCSKMDYLCAQGQTPYTAYNKLKFETLALDISKYMIPLQSTYTQSGSSNEGGAPKKDDDELSEEGQKTRDSGKNDDRGSS